ncbi:hypothetical protein NCCNTM_12770 [Mycolicibacterium sp. NCC-Tsukiji]|nr:hypothetical protein NCCNTM_12770 [Mycolicibacterium sp. NCC-Tsukiji]
MVGLNNGWVARDYRPWSVDQGYLIPPDLREWIEADHPVWTIIDVVGQIDTAAFHARPDHKKSQAGRRGYNPDCLLAVLMYAYAVGERSSRKIEKLCWTDVAFRIACGNDIPDHSVIARFRQRHDKAFESLFTEILQVCVSAGMGDFSILAVDGTKIAANASGFKNRDEDKLLAMAARMELDEHELARRVRAAMNEAAAVDAAEDRAERANPKRPAPVDRTAAIAAALEEIKKNKAERAANPKPQSVELAREQLAASKAHHAGLIAKSEAAHERWRQAAQTGDRSRVGNQPVPTSENKVIIRAARAVANYEQRLAQREAAAKPDRANLTDPQSRMMKTYNSFGQCYNAQLVVSNDYLIVAARATNDPTDSAQYQPTMAVAQAQITTAVRHAGRDDQIGTVLADAGYCSNDNLTAQGPDRLIATTATGKHPPKGPIKDMNARVAVPEVKALYRRRAATIEPVNAHLKHRRGLRQFARRGLSAVQGELLLAAAVTNIMRYRVRRLA